jgi:hypothetical protein
MDRESVAVECCDQETVQFARLRRVERLRESHVHVESSGARLDPEDGIGEVVDQGVERRLLTLAPSSVDVDPSEP